MWRTTTTRRKHTISIDRLTLILIKSMDSKRTNRQPAAMAVMASDDGGGGSSSIAARQPPGTADGGSSSDSGSGSRIRQALLVGLGLVMLGLVVVVMMLASDGGAGVSAAAGGSGRRFLRAVETAAVGSGGFSLAGDGDGPHKPLWPLDGTDVATVVLATLGLVIAAGGGIGGGGALVRALELW